MARKNNSLAGAFSQYEEAEQRQSGKEESSVGVLNKEDDISNEVTGNSNNDSITKDVILEGNKVEEPISQGVSENTKQKPKAEDEEVLLNNESTSKTLRDVTNSIMDMYKEKSNKKTVEETHTRATFLFRNDLQKRLDKLSSGKRGFKTMFMNKAIEAMLDELENK